MTFLASRCRSPRARGRDRRAAPEGRRVDRRATRGHAARRSTRTHSPAELDSLWDQLALLHADGMAHRRIDLDRDRRQHDDGTAGSAICRRRRSRPATIDLAKDRAQLFGLGTLATGEEAAAARARHARSAIPTLIDVIPYLQEAACRRSCVPLLNRRDVDLDDVRKRLADTFGAEKVELVKLRRVTWGSVFNMALLSVAAYTIIGMLGGIDFDEFWNALQDANWWWLFFALFIGQTPRVARRSARWDRPTHPCRSGRRPRSSSPRVTSTSRCRAPPAAWR